MNLARNLQNSLSLNRLKTISSTNENSNLNKENLSESIDDCRILLNSLNLPDCKELNIIDNALTAISLEVSARFAMLTKKDFINYYYDILPEFETPEKAFEKCQNIQKMLIGETMFKNFKEFRKSLGMA